MGKILFIAPHISGKGGTETVLRTVVQLMLKHKYEYEPKVFVLGGSVDKQWLEGLPAEESPFNRNIIIHNTRYFFTLIHLLRKEKPEVVVSLDPMICLFVSLIRRLFHGRYILVSWIHFSLDSASVRTNLVLKADCHLSISSGITRQLIDLGVDKGNIFTVLNPVAKTDDVIKRPETRTTFIYLGRVLYEGQKRIKDLLEALSKVKGDWTLEVYGEGPDKTKCQVFAEQRGIANKVSWKGYVSNPWGQIRQASALILSSAYEGMPMVLAEAIARGVYCISSNCPTGPEDIIVDGVNGELFPTGNVQALQQKLQEIVNGRSLPDQSNMKRSIEKLYTDQYYKKLTGSLSKIVHTFQ